MSTRWGTSRAGSVIFIMFVCVLAACSPAANGRSNPSASDFKPAERSVVCQFHDPALVEISGLASSTQHPDILWTHNDSGDAAQVFAVDAKTCDVKATIKLKGVDARDIEAIAVGKMSSGVPVIWVGDIGDNADSWSSVRLYRFVEPKSIRDQTVNTTSYSVTYNDGPHDAEGLLVSPKPGGSMWIVTKSRSTQGGMYKLPDNFVQQGSGVARRVGPAISEATDASYAPDGSSYAIRSYFSASMFPAPPPSNSGKEIDIPLQPQGEAMTYSANSQFFYFAGERSNDLWVVPKP